jgi:hypothetical protein
MAALWLHRRDFLMGLGCAGLAVGLPKLSAVERSFRVRRVREYSGAGIALPAIASPWMPEVLVIEKHNGGAANFPEILSKAGYVEFRRYAFPQAERLAQLEKAFSNCGIRPLLTCPDGVFVFSFTTLAEREKAWREWCAAPECTGLGAQLAELSIYKNHGL